MTLQEQYREALPKMTQWPCRVCGSEEEVERHHLVSRQHRLPFDHMTVPLCRLCHDDTHGENGLHARIIARRRLRQALTSVEVAFIVKAKGPNYLRRKYPSRTVYTSRVAA